MPSHYCSSFMAAFLFFLVSVLVMSSSSITAQGPPFPGFYPSSSIQSSGFSQYFRNLWGPQHQRLDDQGSVTIWLDSTSGERVKETTTMQLVGNNHWMYERNPLKAPHTCRIFEPTSNDYYKMSALWRFLFEQFYTQFILSLTPCCILADFSLWVISSNRQWV